MALTKLVDAGAWQVEVAPAGTVQDSLVFLSPRNFGGVPGTGVDSVAAIEAALAAGNVDLGGEHWFISRPIYCVSGRTIQNGKISTLAAQGSGFMAGSIFAPGNYHPVYVDPVPKLACSSTNGSATITVSSHGFVVGDLVRLSSTRGIIGSDAVLVPWYMQLARVVGVSGNTVKLDAPVDTTETLVVHKATPAGYNARFNKPLFVLERATFRNIEVDTWDYWTADSATFECTFEGIRGKARSVVYGNTFCRTTFDNIDITFSNKASEMAFGSHDTSLSNIKFRADSQNWDSTNSVGISWAESGRRCTLDNWQLLVPQGVNLSVLVRISSHRDVQIRKGFIQVHSSSNNILSVEHYGGDRPPCNNILFEDIDVNATGAAAVVVDVYKSANDSAINAVRFEGISYRGATPSVALMRQRGTASNQVTGVRASLYSANGGAFLVSSAMAWDVRLYGPGLQVPAAVAVLGRTAVLSASRSNLHALRWVTEAIIGVTSTTPGNVLREAVIPAGTLRASDYIDFVISGSTGGATSTKDVLVGVLDSGSNFQGVGFTAPTTEESYYTVQGRISFPTTGNCLITATIGRAGVGVSYARTLVSISNYTTNDVKLQVQAWVGSSAGSLSVQHGCFAPSELTG